MGEARLGAGRRRRAGATLLAAGAAAAVAALASLPGGGMAIASSHREAPLIAGDPQHDNTDVYAFTSPDKPDTVTLIANWIPFEEPNGGPNFYPFAAGSHYDINIDSSGTGKPDITYRWTFANADARGQAPNGGTFLYNNGPVQSLDDPHLLFKQTYTLEEIKGGQTTTLVGNGVAAPSDVGVASMPNYAALRDQAISKLPDGGQTLAGQAADPFFLDLRVFDLLYGGNFKEAGHNTLAGYNVNTIALQVPKSDLALAGDPGKNPVIGVWSSTEKQSLQLSAGKATPMGDFVQVSRLGNPLVNELISPAQLKDAYNSLSPDQDHTVQPLVDRVNDPEVPKLIEQIYGLPAPAAPRKDIFEIFLTGITGKYAGNPINKELNSQLDNAGVSANSFVPAEEERLNMSIPVAASPSRLGVLGNDLQGFPNGRRLTDDVVDVELLALEGTATTGKIPPALANGDGSSAPASPPGSTFPYVALPNTASVNQAAAISGGGGGDGSQGSSGGSTVPNGGVGTGAGGTARASAGVPALPAALSVLAILGAGAGVVVLRGGRARRSG